MKSLDPVNLKTAGSERKEVQLLKKVASNRDRKAMECIYHEYKIRLGAFIFRILNNNALVEEAYNDIMLIIWQKASQFNGNSKVSTWIFSIAYRHSLQRLRKENKHISSNFDVEQIVEANNASVDQHQTIVKALIHLSFEHRTVIELAYFMGNNYAEIATITDCPESTVKTRMFYARRHLQKELSKIGVTSAM